MFRLRPQSAVSVSRAELSPRRAGLPTRRSILTAIEVAVYGTSLPTEFTPFGIWTLVLTMGAARFTSLLRRLQFDAHREFDEGRVFADPRALTP